MNNGFSIIVQLLSNFVANSVYTLTFELNSTISLLYPPALTLSFSRVTKKDYL